MSFVLITDTCIDISEEMAKELNIIALPLSFQIDDKEYINYLDGREMSPQLFYQKVREGKKSVTSAVNMQAYIDIMRPILEDGNDILCMPFSSALSNTCNSAFLAVQELAPSFPDRKMFVVDTLCASMGQGLLVYLAANKRNEGASILEVRDYVESIKLNLCHWFTVDDLHHLKRGGRVSTATAVIGTVLGIKPVLHVDNGGNLVKVSAVRGRRQSLTALVDKMVETAINPADQVVFISHGDCLDDAKIVADEIKDRLGVDERNIFINFVGSVIGSHSGPGTVALFFLGKER